MDEVAIDIACPICHKEGQVKMRTHIDEIPYFGEHTQVTVLCRDCGWRQTDFIPAEGKKPSACEFGYLLKQGIEDLLTLEELSLSGEKSLRIHHLTIGFPAGY